MAAACSSVMAQPTRDAVAAMRIGACSFETKLARKKDIAFLANVIEPHAAIVSKMPRAV